MRGGVVRLGSPADERGREAPREPYEDEAQDVVEDWGLFVRGHDLFWAQGKDGCVEGGV